MLQPRAPLQRDGNMRSGSSGSISGKLQDLGLDFQGLLAGGAGLEKGKHGKDQCSGRRRRKVRWASSVFSGGHWSWTSAGPAFFFFLSFPSLSVSIDSPLLLSSRWKGRTSGGPLESVAGHLTRVGGCRHESLKQN